MATTLANKAKKRVNIIPRGPIITVIPPIRTTLRNVSKPIADIRKCILAGAKVEEIIDTNGTTIELNLQNYDLNNAPELPANQGRPAGDTSSINFGAAQAPTNDFQPEDPKEIPTSDTVPGEPIKVGSVETLEAQKNKDSKNKSTPNEPDLETVDMDTFLETADAKVISETPVQSASINKGKRGKNYKSMTPKEKTKNPEEV